ncbi:MAG: hypothetical protein H8E14_12045 [Candidatus Marinimicrobia bacterium]|nr:hypothetical protein [Candidatus Neomarinimicrobiota bacterium]
MAICNYGGNGISTTNSFLIRSTSAKLNHRNRMDSLLSLARGMISSTTVDQLAVMDTPRTM